MGSSGASIQADSPIICAREDRRSRQKVTPMQETITGRAYVLGDNVDTDQIIPAQWLKLSTTDPEERKFYAAYCLSSVPEGQRGLPQGNIPFIREGEFKSDYTIIVGGKNFGSGSSREHAPLALA